MSLSLQRPSLWAALVAGASWALPARAQLPVTPPEAPAEGTPPPEVSSPEVPLPEVPSPSGQLEPPAPAPSAPPAASAEAPLPSPAPARADVIGVGKHPYGDDDDDDDEPLGLSPRRTWYGWQTLVVDGAAFSAVLLGAAIDGSGTDGGNVALLGLLGYEFGPGIVHFVHRNPGRGFASFGVRLGMPLTGAFLGASLSSNCDGYKCEADGAALGFLLGMAGAIAIDAAVFAYDERRPSARPNRASTTVVPLVSVQPGRAWVGIGGRL